MADCLQYERVQFSQIRHIIDCVNE
jgi:hypothetical protein